MKIQRTSMNYEENTNFSQTKLEKHEWEYIEVPVSENEKKILNNIMNGYENPYLSIPSMQSLLSYLKIENNDKHCDLHTFVTVHYFNDILSKITTLYRLLIKYVFISDLTIFDNFTNFIKNRGLCIEFDKENNDVCILSQLPTKIKELKRKDRMRVENTMLLIKNDEHKISSIYEYVISQQVFNVLSFIFTKECINKNSNDDFFIKTMKGFSKKKKNNKETQLFVDKDEFIKITIDRIYALNLFLKDNTITNCNPILVSFMDSIIQVCISFVKKQQALTLSHLWIENNTLLNKYSSFSLYQHQQDIISIFKKGGNHFVYYCAPTGTGKTLTPLALAKHYKIIFVCAARHVGLSFAKNAISCGYKIALAFNCGDSEDIRLHFSAAKKFKKNYKTGGIFRVDNTIGDNVEIIISDIKSYKYASYYMSAFNDVNTIITFWDEPTISLDYEEHDLHYFIRDNCENNIIPNMVLSSATLPKKEDIENSSVRFCEKFNAKSHYIKTHDFRKSICIYDNQSHIFSPHMFFIKETTAYNDAISIIKTIMNDKTLFRYLHVSSCIEFLIWFDNECKTIAFLNDENPMFKWDKLTQETIKEMYISIISNDMNILFYERLLSCKTFVPQFYYNSTYHFIRNDAFTLTNGATIYLTNDINQTRQWFISEIKIPKKCIDLLRSSYDFNETLNKKINEIKKTITDKTSKNDKTYNKEDVNDFLVSKETSMIRVLETQYKKIQLPQILIPNSYEHIRKYHGDGIENKYSSHYRECFKPFTSSLSERDIEKVILLNDIDQDTQFLLLCGIGVVCSSMTNEYNALISEFATRQKLFMVIASSDYIFGTNYLFHHAYLDDSIKNNTRQKIIQAMGRVGRGQHNHHYSVRIKNNDIISMLFNENYDSYIETKNMNKLFIFLQDDNIKPSENSEKLYIKEEECLNIDEWTVGETTSELNQVNKETYIEHENIESWEDLY